MLITFYGVRGSLPTPGDATVRYGGNTSCVHVRTRSGRDLIFDAGTGIRTLGKQLVASAEPVNLYLTHSHWDHIQGFPFFDPIFQPGREIRICTPFAGEATPATHDSPHPQTDNGHAIVASVLEQMNGHNFPLVAGDVPARIEYVSDPVAISAQDGLALTRKPLNHPGGGYSYRIEDDGLTFAYVTDNELDPPTVAATTYDAWVEHLRGVDVLVHDAQYRQTDMPDKHGWGHSLISQVRQLAFDADVSCLVLFHHDPMRTDDELDEVRLESEHFFRGKNVSTQCIVAREGLALEIRTGTGKVGRRVQVTSS